MNREKIRKLIRNYIDNLRFLDDRKMGPGDNLLWETAGAVCSKWYIDGEDYRDRICFCISRSAKLTDSSITRPGEGILLLMDKEPEAVRNAFTVLLAEKKNPDYIQENIGHFITRINALNGRLLPGQWRYTQNAVSATMFQALIEPHHFYRYRWPDAQIFAKAMESGEEIGYGKAFSLKAFYRLCEEVLEAVNASEELIKADAGRNWLEWHDPSHHLLVSSIMYNYSAYRSLQNGIPLSEPDETTASALELRKELNRIQCQIAECREILEYPDSDEEEKREAEKEIRELETEQEKAFNQLLKY